MPLFNDLKQDGMPLRILAYGVAKTKKTWWAGTAAEYGLNVLHIDGDDGYHILSNLSPAAKERIFVCDVMDSFRGANMCYFMTLLLKGQPFGWDEVNKAFVLLDKGGNPMAPAANARIILFDPSKLSINDLLVIDSWTAFVESLNKRFYIEHKIDITAKSDAESNWDGYRWSGAMADWALQQIKALPCSVLIIAHTQVYEKKKNEVDGNGVQKQVTEWTRTQVKSTSGNHALRLAKYFSDILYFRLVGKQFYIDTKADEERDGGSRLVKPDLYTWDRLPFAAFATAAKIKPASAPLEAAKYYVASAVVPATKTMAFSAPSAGVVVPPVKSAPMSLNALLLKQKETAS